jgi:hypothetical protein
MIFAIKTAAPLHGDLRVGEVQLQLSTWSWMMANHMTNHLSCGISLVLYDGSFLFPRQDTMFDLVEAFKSVTDASQDLSLTTFFPELPHSLYLPDICSFSRKPACSRKSLTISPP